MRVPVLRQDEGATQSLLTSGHLQEVRDLHHGVGLGASLFALQILIFDVQDVL